MLTNSSEILVFLLSNEPTDWRSYFWTRSQTKQGDKISLLPFTAATITNSSSSSGDRYRIAQKRMASWKMTLLQFLIFLGKPYLLQFTSLCKEREVSVLPVFGTGICSVQVAFGSLALPSIFSVTGTAHQNLNL